MKDSSKTKQELIQELSVLKQRIQEMEQADEALQCERDNLANILNVMNDGVYIVDQQYDIQFVNTVLKNVFGPWQGMKCYAYFHNRTELCSWCPNQKVFAGETVRWEWYSERDGKTYDLIDTPMNSPDGRILKLEIFRDITKRKQTEEALSRTEEKFRRSLDGSPLGIRIVTAEGETIYANRTFLDIHGYDSIEELKTIPVEKRYTPGSYAEFKIRREKRKRGDYDPSEYEINIIRKDGEVRNLQVFRKEVLWGGERHFQVIYQDMTERKRAEKTLQLITDNMSDMIRVTDLQGVNLYTSPSHFTVLGYKSEDRVGKSGFDIVHPDDVEHLIKVFSEGLINKKSPGKIEYRVKHAEGHYVWLETMGDFIRGDHGEVTAVIQSSRDITERKKAEEEIRKGNMLLNTIIENIPSTLFLKDARELRFLMFNRAAEDLIGYSRADVLGKNDYDFVLREQADFFTETDREVLRGKDVVDIPKESLQTRTKGVRTLHTRKVPILSASGDPEYLLGISEDITDRKQAEEAMRESEEQYRTLFESIADTVFLIDQETGSILDVNPAATRMYGFNREEFLRMTTTDVSAEPEKTASATREPVPFIPLRYHRHKDGSVFPVELTASIFELRGRNTIITTARDITERKQAEQALRESEEKYRGLVENVSDVIYEIDSQGVVVYISPVIRDIMGYDPADVVGKNFIEFVYEVDRSNLIERFFELREGIESPSEYRLISKTGDIRWVRTKTNPVTEDGSFKGARGTLIDISGRKQAEEEKRILQERVQRLEKMETLGNLAGGVAHDLNNILGILVGYSELLSHEIDKNSPLRKYAQTIMNSGQRAAAVVQDLLTLARRGVVIRQTANLNRIVRDQLETPELLGLILSHPLIRIKPNCDEDLLNIKGSAVHISATLTNLVLNAAEAMPEGGVISIRTENRHIDRPLTGYEEVQKGDYAVLSVSDTGSGISPEDLKHIFEPFYTRKVMGRSGSGLGLSVVWGTMKDHDGYIDVTTARGKGTTFTLYFPVTPDEFIIEETISVDEYTGKGETILVVDDEAGQRSLATRMLTKLNYQATAVSSGEEAVEYLQQHDVDLVVLDMIMDPGIDGYEAYRRIMELKKKQKAIIVSGFTETERVRMAKELGAGAFVKKPFLMERLGIAVRKELDRVA